MIDMVWLYRSLIPVGRMGYFTCSNEFYEFNANPLTTTSRTDEGEILLNHVVDGVQLLLPVLHGHSRLPKESIDKVLSFIFNVLQDLPKSTKPSPTVVSDFKNLHLI